MYRKRERERERDRCLRDNLCAVVCVDYLLSPSFVHLSSLLQSLSMCVCVFGPPCCSLFPCVCVCVSWHMAGIKSDHVWCTHLNIQIYISTYINVYICTYTYIFTYMYINTYIYIYTYECVHKYVYLYTYLYTYEYIYIRERSCFPKKYV